MIDLRQGDCLEIMKDILNNAIITYKKNMIVEE